MAKFEPPDDDDDAAPDDYEDTREALYDLLSNFADEHDLALGALSPILIDIGVTWRMSDYALSVEKPSGAGLKLEIDRMRRDIEDHLRSCKRHADEFIAETKELLWAEAEGATGEDDEPQQ